MDEQTNKKIELFIMTEEEMQKSLIEAEKRVRIEMLKKDLWGHLNRNIRFSYETPPQKG